MPKFDKRFVHFMWSDKLKGKTVFFADSISYLKERVENNVSMYYGEVVQVENYRPFQMAHGKEPWTFCYYDPYYELKWAHEQGMTIQAHVGGNMWVNIKEPSWEDRPECYRVEPDEKTVTNRELALWIAQGNGEIYHYDDSGFKTEVKTSYGYHQEYENCDCNEDKTLHCKIRKWGDTEWVTPTREYMGLE